MAPRPCLRLAAIVVCAVLLIAIMTTQYSGQFVEQRGDRRSSSGSSRTLMGHSTHHYQYINGDAGVNRPDPDITALHLDDRTTGMREPNTNVRPFAGSIPSIIHFVWCGQRYFEFKHYLAVQSAIKVTQADKIVVHYESEPEIDELYYHQWFMDLTHDYPFLHAEKISDSDLVVCRDVPLDLKIAVILRYMSEEGGIYIGSNTWLLKMSPEDRKLDLLLSLQPEDMDGYFAVAKGLATNKTLSDILAEPDIQTKRTSCTTISQFYRGFKDPQCLVVKGGRFDSFFPMQIWDLPDDFGRVARKIFYGTDEMPSPKPSFDELVPNIGHMIWLGGGRMDFVFYLSALSLMYVVKVDTLYIHGDQEPKGDYWPRLKADPKVQFVLRPQPRLIYQGEIEWYYRALMSDLIRVDIMIKYGGIYTDTDAIWVKPLTHEDRGYEAVASYDWVDWSYPYPDSVNFGLSYGKKNAPFWRIFRDSMRQLHNDVHGFSGVMMPYKLLEKYPELLRIDRRLSVICYKFRCHPTYVKNYHDENNDHVTSNSIPNWREDVYAFHWTHPNPREYANETTLVNSKGMFAEIGQFVLKSAGLL